MSDFGAGGPGVSNINVTLDDYAERPIPSVVTGNTGFPFTTGNYRPANSGATDAFPGPAPAAPYTYTLSAFNGDSPNGTWNLYIVDDANLDGGSLSGGWSITFDSRPAPPAAGDILISEFRTRGAGTTPPGSDGSVDEFIELYNNTDQSITLIDAIPGADPTSVAGAGWRIGVAQGAAENDFVVISQTIGTTGPLAIAPRSYFLFSSQPTAPSPAGNTYSLSTYPTGTGITSSGSGNIVINPASANGFLPDDAGIAIFSTAAADSARRLDSVGSTGVTAADYKEGTGLTPITTAGQHSWVRREASGFPSDTGNNATDFVLVDTLGRTLDGVPAVLGAPGPQRGHTATAFTTTAAPMHGSLALTPLVLDPAQTPTTGPNMVFDPTPVANGSSGTLKIRRVYRNDSSKNLLALRFRIVDISTQAGGAPPLGGLDLRVLGSPVQTVTLTDSSTRSLAALALQTPAAQTLGGGLNSSLTAGVITTTAPLASGASVAVEFNLGVNTADTALPYRFVVIAEGLPFDGIGGVSARDEFGTFGLGADLSITKSDGVPSAVAGSNVTYTIVASNMAGPAPTTALVSDTFPAACTTVNWTCTASGSGTCSTSGSGAISDSVNLPVGASVTYSAVCSISASATGVLSNTATVASTGGVTDPDLENNSATDTTNLLAPGMLGISPSTIAFASMPVGGSSGAQTVTLTNTGDEVLTVTALTAATGPFALSGGSCGTPPFMLLGGASCTLSYVFSPTAPGAASQSITVTANVPVSGPLALSGTGTGGGASGGGVQPVAVPTMGEWGVLLLGLLAAGLGVRGVRRRQ
ncbi:IPTL-CTERM sorting domain-containing protein [Ottowia thiooxydans]|uniref:IPTL-CTERM sorting domain-containing protein n=1 Tax=Ottowia thiooxydans TaxID=219182 RepID=UPI00146E3B50|nr:IPTL-CTERM sorting domain-containing protein [Ottowia thiooxydans]